MMNPKDTLKDLGATLRSDNSSHQDALRDRLEALASQRAVSTEPRNFWKPLAFLASTAVMASLVVATWPKPPAVVVYDSGFEDFEDMAGLGTGSVGTKGPALDAIGEFFDVGYEPRPAPGDPQEIIDYENEHGSMLSVDTRLSLWSTEDDLVTPVKDLFNSVDGHISGISQYGMGQPTTVTGLVPAASYAFFREEIRDLVSADKYMTEVVNATDLIPAALNFEERIEGVTEAIEFLKAELAKTEDPNAKISLQRQLDNRENELEYLVEAKQELQGEADYVKVSVAVTEIPSLWETREVNDLRNLVMGMEKPGSFAEKAWVNVLTVGFWGVQVLSVAIWFLIPLMIWFAYRRGQRRLWRELD